MKIRRGYKREHDRYMHAVAGRAGYMPEPASETPDGLLERRYAWRAASFTSEVLVPVTLAGGFAVTGAGAGYMLAEWRGAMIGAGVAWGVSFAALVSHQLRSLWIEESFGEEEEVAPQLPEPRQVRVEVAQQDGAGKTRGLRWAELPISDTQYEHLRTYLLNHDRVNRDGLVDAGVCALHGYAPLKAALLAAGLIREIDGKGTAEVTPAGKAMARAG